MVSSRDILKATGLKTVRTLTRWHQQGLIPPPEIHTHPSGRGKLAYWPDWVLRRCQRITELERQGYRPRAAVEVLRLRSFEDLVLELDKLGEIAIPTEAGEQHRVADIFIAVTIASLRDIVAEGARHKLIAAMREAQAFRAAMLLANQGYNPVALTDGSSVDIVPDFLVSHELGDSPLGDRPRLVLPLMPTLRRIYAGLQQKFEAEPKICPAPWVRVRRPDRIIDQQIYIHSLTDFEFIPGTEIPVGKAEASGGDRFGVGESGPNCKTEAPK